MKIVVTGGAGFIGRAVVAELRRIGHDAKVADLKADSSATAPVDLPVDVMDLASLMEAIAGADAVYHLAGPVLETARRDPFHSSALQFNGTLHVLEACRECAVRRLVLASSFYVYDGLPGAGTVNEQSTLDPARMELFGALKVAAEQLVIAYSKKFSLDFVILRFGSAYGWGAGSNLIQTFLGAGLRGEVLEIWGKGVRMNQYTYLQDIAAGAASALDLKNEIVNLISPEEISTGELADLFHRRYGFETRLLIDKPEGADFPYMSARKAIRLLEWKPTPLVDALDELVQAKRLQQAEPAAT